MIVPTTTERSYRSNRKFIKSPIPSPEYVSAESVYRVSSASIVSRDVADQFHGYVGGAHLVGELLPSDGSVFFDFAVDRERDRPRYCHVSPHLCGSTRLFRSTLLPTATDVPSFVAFGKRSHDVRRFYHQRRRRHRRGRLFLHFHYDWYRFSRASFRHVVVA